MDILRKAWEIGLMNLHIEEQFGGPEMSDLDEVIIAEELNYGCSGVATAILANNLALAPVLVGASDELKRKFVEPLTAEEVVWEQ